MCVRASAGRRPSAEKTPLKVATHLETAVVKVAIDALHVDNESRTKSEASITEVEVTEEVAKLTAIQQIRAALE